MKLQTIYIPTSDDNNLLVGSIDKHDYYKSFTKERNVKEIEAFVFTPEELKKLLEDYTDRITENVDTMLVDNISNTRTEYRTGQDTPHGYDLEIEVDKESITSQLPEFLKEIGL